MDQNPKWLFKKEDQILLEGVLLLIFFLKNHFLVKDKPEVLQTLEAIKEAFGKMPAHIPGVDISLGYTIRHKDSDVEQGLVGGVVTYCQYWCVDLNEGTLEIYSSTINTNTMPQDNPGSLDYKLHLNQLNTNIPFYYEEWKEEVKNPEVFWSPDYEREITIELNERKFWLID